MNHLKSIAEGFQLELERRIANGPDPLFYALAGDQLRAEPGFAANYKTLNVLDDLVYALTGDRRIPQSDRSIPEKELRGDYKSKTANGLEHDVRKPLEKLGHFCAATTVDFGQVLPANTTAALTGIEKAAEGLAILIADAVYHPLTLLRTDETGRIVFEKLYDALLREPFAEGAPSDLDEDARTYLSRIDLNQDLFQRLVNEHLRYGHKVGHFDLAHYARALERGADGIVIIHPYSQGPFEIRAPVGRVFDNLVGNARKAAPDGTVIQIGHWPSPCGNYTDVHVTDNGHGVPPEHQPRIFDDGFSGFALLSPERVDHGRNSGTGLTASRDAMRKLGGDLHLYHTEAGQGTTFRVRVPNQYIRSA